MQNMRGDESGWEHPVPIQLGPSVKVVECRYKCGGFFVVTTMLKRPPGHIECAIKRAIEHNINMHEHKGDDWEKYLQRLHTWTGMQLRSLHPPTT